MTRQKETKDLPEQVKGGKVVDAVDTGLTKMPAAVVTQALYDGQPSQPGRLPLEKPRPLPTGRTSSESIRLRCG